MQNGSTLRCGWQHTPILQKIGHAIWSQLSGSMINPLWNKTMNSSFPQHEASLQQHLSPWWSDKNSEPCDFGSHHFRHETYLSCFSGFAQSICSPQKGGCDQPHPLTTSLTIQPTINHPFSEHLPPLTTISDQPPMRTEPAPKVSVASPFSAPSPRGGKKKLMGRGRRDFSCSFFWGLNGIGINRDFMGN